MRIRRQPKKYANLTKQDKETLFNYFKPITPRTMSIWEKPEFAQGKSEVNPSSMFINKALGDGDSIVLTFKDVFRQMQAADTAEDFKTEDGYEFNFYFEDSNKKERMIRQKNTKGVFFRAMREAAIEPGEQVKITRNGTGVETRYTIEKGGELSTVFNPPQLVVEPVPTKEIPF